MRTKDSILFVLFAVFTWLSNFNYVWTSSPRPYHTSTFTWDAHAGVMFCLLLGFVLWRKLAHQRPLTVHGFRPRLWPFLLLIPLVFQLRSFSAGQVVRGYGNPDASPYLVAYAAGVLVLWQWLLWMRQQKEVPPKLA